MDVQVEQALAKWPNVPHCYGWLSLDARGCWRMRNEQAQQCNLPGDKITQPTLVGFIERNYTHDEKGQWYFQNGPQRVYVDLQAAPFIAHQDPQNKFVLHTNELLGGIKQIWLSDQGKIWMQSADKIALLDDRDLAASLTYLHVDREPATENHLLSWIDGDDALALTWNMDGVSIAVKRLEEDYAERWFSFARIPSDR